MSNASRRDAFTPDQERHNLILQKIDKGREELSPYNLSANVHCTDDVANSLGYGGVGGLFIDVPRYDNKRRVLTLMHKAAERGDIVMIKWLISRGVSSNVVARDRKTPLFYAIRAMQSNAAAYLITECNADVNHASDSSREESGELLWLAVTHQNIDIVKLLLDSGVDVNSLYNQRSILLTAAFSGNPLMVQIFIGSNARLKHLKDIRNNKGIITHVERDIVKEMVIRGYQSTLKILLKNGADCSHMDDRGLTPLHYTVIRRVDHGPYKISDSASLGNAPAAELLIQAGASILKADKDGNTPLHLAAQVGAENVARVLLSSIAVHDTMPMSDDLPDPLEPGVCEPRELRITDILEALNTRGFTPLCVAAGNIHYGMVKLLIEHGANPFVYNTTEEISSALHAANDSEVSTRNRYYSPNMSKRADDMLSVKVLLGQAENYVISRVIECDSIYRTTYNLPSILEEHKIQNAKNVFCSFDPEYRRMYVCEFAKGHIWPELGNPLTWEPPESVTYLR